MTGDRLRPKPKRPVPKHRLVMELRPDVCGTCGKTLQEGKYHDCGNQLALPIKP